MPEILKKHHRPFIFPVVSGDDSDRFDDEFDTDVEKVLGIQLTSDFMDFLYHRGDAIQLEINGQELLPEDFPTKAVMANQGVAPDNRYTRKFMLPEGGLDVGNRRLIINYTDKDHPSATPFKIYELQVLAVVKLKENQEVS